MTPDDPRHGTWAGRHAHWKDGSEPCDPCKDAAFRRNKRIKRRLDAGIRHRIPLGQQAMTIVNTIPTKDLAAETGIARDSLQRMRRNPKGHRQIVLRSTQEKILAAAAVRPSATVIGLARRLQGITYMGYSMMTIAREFGCARDTLLKIRRGETHMYISRTITQIILDAYSKYWDAPAPRSQSSDRTRSWAVKYGYVSPLAWDDDTIDDPTARPQGMNRHDARTVIDEAAIERRIAGDRGVRLHKAETAEVARRLVAAGVSTRAIREDYGIKAERYIKVSDQREQVAA